MTDYIAVFCTVQTHEEAFRISQEIISKKIAACVNIINGITSVYEWNDEVCNESEFLMIIKTRKELFDELKNKIISMHSYDVPEVISFNITDGFQPYLDWIQGNTNKPQNQNN